MDYQEIVKIITDKIIKNLKNNDIKKIRSEDIINSDISFGGILKSFSEILDLNKINIIVGEFKKGEGLKKHYHKFPIEEVYYILEGEVEVTIGSNKIIAKRGDVLSVKPEVVHWPLNKKDEVSKILFILSQIEESEPVLVE